jgi:UTP--glucose-1-phosphate uridylyltransferase
MAIVKPVRKAVLPAAGFGTRFLPVTKAVPKELLPIVDVPAIQINVEECVASGIRDLILITSRGKDALVDYFDRGAELEELLERKGKQEDLAMIRRLTDLAHISAIRQAEARGLGHAVLCARGLVVDEPFAVLLGDDLLESDEPGIKQLLDVYAKYGKGVVGLWEVPSGQEHLYGIVAGESLGGGVFRLNRLVEKPEPGKAPSSLAIVGRYILPPEIFPILANTKPGKGGEIQLTDALATLCASDGLYGVLLRGERFDAGDRTGYVLAVLRYALRRSDIGAAVRVGAEKLLRKT